VVNVKGRYNVLLGHDWIHTKWCVPSTLHQCVVQWVGDVVEVIRADDSAYVAMAGWRGKVLNRKGSIGL
jgi:hypothetical protein